MDICRLKKNIFSEQFNILFSPFHTIKKTHLGMRGLIPLYRFTFL